MKILLSNKFYYNRGGDCIYTIELDRLLRKRGHEVAIFTQQFNNNLDSEFSDYWPSMVDYTDIKSSSLIESVFRPIYSKEVKQKIQSLLNDFSPDIVHLNNIHSQISPIVAQVAYKNNIPVVWTLHDYKLLCPAYNCLRDGQVCELCFNKKINVVKHKCVKNLIGSIIAYFEAIKWNKDLLQKYTDLFIAPSRFMKNKMNQGGFNSNSINVLNNFIEDKKIASSTEKKEDYYLYFGRISEEKGIETLLDAASQLPYRLKLAGTGPLLEKLKNKYKDKSNIEFLGFKEWDHLKKLITKAQFFVLPSEWYENNPLSIIESLSLGTPVLGANIGGIPEIIVEKETGYIFESGNVNNLRNKISYFFESVDSKELGKNAIEYAKNNFKSSNYYKKIMNIYRELINEK